MSPSISNLRLCCSFLLLAQIAQVVLTLKAGLMSVVADHPQGCYGYKGPSHVSDDMYVRQDACIYSMKGENERGEFMEATGIRIESTIPDLPYIGVQFNVCGLNFSVETSGSAVVEFKPDNMRFEWQVNPHDLTFNGFNETIDYEIPASVSGYLPGNRQGHSNIYYLKGQAAHFGTIIDGHVPVKDRYGSSVFTARQAIQMLLVKGGWSYHVSFGWTALAKDSELMIAKGVMYS